MAAEATVEAEMVVAALELAAEVEHPGAVVEWQEQYLEPTVAVQAAAVRVVVVRAAVGEAAGVREAAELAEGVMGVADMDMAARAVQPDLEVEPMERLRQARVVAHAAAGEGALESMEAVGQVVGATVVVAAMGGAAAVVEVTVAAVVAVAAMVDCAVAEEEAAER